MYLVGLAPRKFFDGNIIHAQNVIKQSVENALIVHIDMGHFVKNVTKNSPKNNLRN